MSAEPVAPPREAAVQHVSWIGQPIPRREDVRFVTGGGRYTDDVAPRDAAHAVFVRSIEAHARITAIRADDARAVAGVLAVLTAADYEADGNGPIRHVPNPADAVEPSRPAFESEPGGRPVVEILQPPLARDAVRYVGEAVAMIVATSAAAARDAAELVEVDYETLPAVAAAPDALAPGAPQLWPEAPGNLAFDLAYGDARAVDDAFARADVAIAHEFVQQRVIAAHMEPRSAFASWDPANGYAITAGGQGVLRFRVAAAAALRVAPERVRFISPDVGGGFGSRNNLHVEPVLVAWAARRVGRTVRWTAERGEGFLTDYHGRDLVLRVELALASDGRILAVRYDDVANVGAYTVSFASLQNAVRVATGPYRVPACTVRVRAVLTNTTPTAPYRGAGRPEVVHAFERLLDLAAQRLTIDRVDLRRRNLLRRAELPHRSPMGLTYDAGDFAGNMERVLARADWDGFPSRRRASEQRGKLRGIAVANYLETPVGAPREKVVVSLRPDGTVDVVTGTQSNGQGHETTFAQIAAELLAVPLDAVTIRGGDTAFVDAGGGTHSNRSLRLVGTLLVTACEDLRARPRAPGETLVASAETAQRIPAFPTGSAVCEVEIDPATGVVEVVRYTSVDDVGRPVNPLIVDGQTHGGIAQGIGQALGEIVRYDRATAQPAGTSFMSYAVPRACRLPSYDLELVEDPTSGNPLRIKGGGEAGVTPSPAVVVNAICDALAAYGVDDVPMPATPETVWRLLRGAPRNPVEA